MHELFAIYSGFGLALMRNLSSVMLVKLSKACISFAFALDPLST